MNQLSPVTLSLRAMATRFELVMYGENKNRLVAAGEEALGEIERLEQQLSFYENASEINYLNRNAANHFVKIEPRLFKLLKDCAALHQKTDNAFDITIAPLMRAWRFIREQGGVPTADELESARRLTGMQHLEFDDETFAIHFKQAGVEIDLGGFGKGYAVQCAIDLLKENGIQSALLHGGTSSVATIGTPPAEKFWRIELPEPFKQQTPVYIHLANHCLSVSAIHGKSFVVDGKRFGHLINPVTGESISRTLAAAVVGQDAAVCEALTKALMIHSKNWFATFEARFPDYQGLVVDEIDGIFGNLKN
ncbi:MAG: FAD:protein FMN transferase [Acidobacteriota bacterium]